MARRGRLGALVTLSRHDPAELTRKARETYAASFAIDHSGCALCGHPQPIPPELSPDERARRGECLRLAHFARLAHAREAARRSQVSRSAVEAPPGREATPGEAAA